MTRKMMVPFLAAAAMLAGSAIATAQDSHPNDFVASDRAFSGPFYDTRYRVSPYQYPDVTTGFAAAPVIVAPAPMATDEVIYSYGPSRLCSGFEYERAFADALNKSENEKGGPAGPPLILCLRGRVTRPCASPRSACD